jgi:hypothetical protein
MTYDSPHGIIELIANFADDEPFSDSPILYQVRREDGAGLMATLGTIVTQVAVAEWLGASPVVDLRKKNAYRETKAINGTHNVWEYYFEKVGAYSTDDLDSGKFRVLRSSPYHPRLTGRGRNLWYREKWNQYVRFNDSTARALSEYLTPLELGERDIGLHVRGGDIKGFPGHPFPPTIHQLVQATRHLLDAGDFDNVFVAAQDDYPIRRLRKEFGGRLKISNNFRVTDRRSARATPFSGRTSRDSEVLSGQIRENHLYLLGLEVLQDAKALSACGALIAGSSNVADWAGIFAGTEYKAEIRIRNGQNVNNRFLAAALWRIRSKLPDRLGGFRRWAMISESY